MNNFLVVVIGFLVTFFTGLQLADELGFKESLSALEQNNKRRSVNGFSVPGSFEPLGVPQNNNRAVSKRHHVHNNNIIYLPTDKCDFHG